MEGQRKGLLLLACVSCLLLASIVGGAAGDVPDGVVYTDLHKTVQKGNETVLSCEFYEAPIAVYWKKGDDPDSGTNLITWVDGEEISGSCVNNKACHMRDDHSLVIEDARIADQGRYICRVSNYLGILIHNYTDVKIIAPPKEPYPVIDQCAKKESSGFNSTYPCKILINTTIIITCSATNYYPDLDLFFLHGSQKMTDVMPSEKTNSDGTKNKSISIKAFASKTPYVCVASGIPGSKDQTAATIFVESSTVIPITRANESPPSPSTSITVTTEISTGNRAAKIVVPIIIIIIVIGAVVVCAFLWWKNPRLFRRIITGDCETGSNSSTKSESEDKIEMTAKETTAGSESATTSVPEERIPLVEKATIAGKISFYELWSLAYDTPSSDMNRVHHVLVNLGFEDVHEGLTAPDVYDLLCKWKDANKKGQHAHLLQSALKSADFESRWVQLCEQRRYVGVRIPGATLDQIILDIESHNKIEHFLRNLLPGQYIKIKGDPVEKAMKLLREWSKSPFKENPFALLSLALERCGCSPVAQTFFAGTVSFFELWSLSRMVDGSYVDNIRDILQHLGLSLRDGLTADDVYLHLCSWKESDKTSFQGKPLRDALERADFKEAWKYISELREKSDTQVSENTLEHILWHIRDPTKIDTLLHKLTLGKPHIRLDINSDLKDIIREAMGYLNTWKKQQFDENPILLLSHALEKTGCSPVDRSFFKVPAVLMTSITELEVQGFVHDLTSRHINTLTQCLGIDKKEDTIYAINEANNDTIFNTEAMITEWVRQEECSNYEKRWRLSEAGATIGRQDLTDHFRKINPEIHLGVKTAHRRGGNADFHQSNFMEWEFQRITTYLSSSELKKLFGGKDDDPQNAIRAFAEDWMAKNPKQSFREEKLRKMLKSAGFKGLIPYRSKSNVYLCELLDIAFRLLLDDVYPLAEALGISGEELNNYRVDYASDHLTKGTTAALIKFSETNKNDRGKVCEALSKAGYKNLAVLLGYGHETSLADEFAVVSRAGGSEEALEKISKNLGMRDTSNIETVLKDWKAMVHPPSYNQRTSLADAVFPVVGKDVAVSILSRKYRNNTTERSAVIQTMSNCIESFEGSEIAKILGVNNSKKLKGQQVITHSPETQLPGESGESGTDIRGQYTPAIAPRDSSIKQVLETWEKKIRKKPLSKDKRRQLSENLLRAGFKQFAFEIMTGFAYRPKKMPRMPKRKNKQDQKIKPEGQNKTEEEDVEDSDDTTDSETRHDTDDQDSKDNVAQNSEDSDDDDNSYDSGDNDEAENKKIDDHASETDEDQANTKKKDQAIDKQPDEEGQA